MMEIKIKTKGKEQIPEELVKDIMAVMDKHNYKNGSLTTYRVCDACECRLSKDYPKDHDLCPNCEAAEHDVKQEQD